MEHTKDAINVSKLDFTSIMFDGSHYPIEENIAKTTELSRMLLIRLDFLSRLKLVLSVEKKTELLVWASAQILTSVRAIADLGVDMLAAGIGNIHGKYPANWKGLKLRDS